MAPNPASENEQLQPLIDQLYQNEALTDALVDSDAAILLAWGESELRRLAGFPSGQVDLDSVARELQRVMRSINRLVGQKAELPDTQLIQRLLRLVEQAQQLALKQAILKKRD